MISQLSITNFGLIEHISIDFHEKLNILTGETGAGKSIIIGALRSALGGKLNTQHLRRPDQPCTLEAVFELNTLQEIKKDLLHKYLDPEDDTLVIRRVLTPEGRHKIRVNGQTVNIRQLKDIGSRLVDFHGPHDHQMLRSSESHLSLLDQLCDLDELSGRYKSAYRDYTATIKEIDQLQALSQNRARELDLLGHQIKELEQVPLDQDSYDENQQKKIKIDSMEKLNELSGEMIQSLGETECSSSEMISRCFAPMKQLSALDEYSQDLATQLDTLQDVHETLLSFLRDYRDNLVFNEEEAHHITEQSDAYHTILRKYGPGVTDAARFLEEARNKYELLANLENNDTQLRKRLTTQKDQLNLLAQDITRERKKRARSLKKTVEHELKCLGIAHVLFEVKFTKKDFGPEGADHIEFYISPNAGEKLKPLADIVSSGEAARVMPALKKALIEVDPIGVLVFDEIDAQIGGRLGTVTGQKLKEISDYRQVLLITHLPQIASFADLHLKVTKSVHESQTLTEVISLRAKERVKEVAQMMSGQRESAVSVKHAKDMLAVAGQ